MKPKSYRKKATRQPAVRKQQAGLVRQATELVQQLRAELPALLAVAVVEVATGTTLAVHTTLPEADWRVAATFQARLVQGKRAALAALALPHEQLQDILITLSSQLHLLRLTGSGQQLVSLVVDAATTNLALARDILRTQAEQLDAGPVLRAA